MGDEYELKQYVETKQNDKNKVISEKINKINNILQS